MKFMRVLCYQIKLFCFTIHHPLDTVLISYRSIVSSPEHISKWHSNNSSFRKRLKEAICLTTRIRMERDMDIISHSNAKSHRCRGIRTHEHMTTKNGKGYMHDQFFIHITQCWHTFRSRNITKSMDSSNKFSPKDRLIKPKNFFCVIWEVKIRSCVGHRENIKRSSQENSTLFLINGNKTTIPYTQFK